MSITMGIALTAGFTGLVALWNWAKLAAAHKATGYQRPDEGEEG